MANTIGFARIVSCNTFLYLYPYVMNDIVTETSSLAKWLILSSVCQVSSEIKFKTNQINKGRSAMFAINEYLQVNFGNFF